MLKELHPDEVEGLYSESITFSPSNDIAPSSLSHLPLSSIVLISRDWFRLIRLSQHLKTIRLNTYNLSSTYKISCVMSLALKPSQLFQNGTKCYSCFGIFASRDSRLWWIVFRRGALLEAWVTILQFIVSQFKMSRQIHSFTLFHATYPL